MKKNWIMVSIQRKILFDAVVVNFFGETVFPLGIVYEELETMQSLSLVKIFWSYCLLKS